MVDQGTGEIIFGFHPVREVLRHRPQEVRRVLVARQRPGKRRQELEALCRRHQVTCTPASEGELRALVGNAVHNGFVAELRAASATAGVEAADPTLWVLVEDVEDPRNLGALLRVCEGAGVGRVLIRDRGSAPITPAVLKTSAGAAEWLAIERMTNTARAIEDAKGDGAWVYGADSTGELPWEVDLTGPLVICIGGEHSGLRARTRSVCDRLIGLPLRGRVGSLNLATAAAALLYEAVRQRTTPKS